MSTSLVTDQPRLSACSETMPMDSYNHIEITAQLFLSQLQNQSISTTLLGRVFSLLFYLVDMSLSPNYLVSFLPQQGCMGLNPNSWSGLEALQMGTLPHLLINS
jgi:hypothetical protein